MKQFKPDPNVAQFDLRLGEPLHPPGVDPVNAPDPPTVQLDQAGAIHEPSKPVAAQRSLDPTDAPEPPGVRKVPPVVRGERILVRKRTRRVQPKVQASSPNMIPLGDDPAKRPWVANAPGIAIAIVVIQFTLIACLYVVMHADECFPLGPFTSPDDLMFTCIHYGSYIAIAVIVILFALVTKHVVKDLTHRSSNDQ